MKCPECNGSGVKATNCTYVAFRGGVINRGTCKTCNGTGEVEEMKDELREAFERWIKDYLTDGSDVPYLQDGGYRMLSACEHGYNSRQPEITALEEEVKRVKTFIEARQVEIETDARYLYPSANIQTNAPLALEQLVMETKLDVYRVILAQLKGEE